MTLLGIPSKRLNAKQGYPLRELRAAVLDYGSVSKETAWLMGNESFSVSASVSTRANIVTT